MTHPLLDLLIDAAAGRFPPADGGVTFLPELDDGNRAVVAFTGHAAVASPWTGASTAGEHSGHRVGGHPLDGFGGAMHPAVLLALAEGGEIGVHDVTMVATGIAGDPPRPTEAFDDHPRVAHARHLRGGVVVYGDDVGFVTLGTGLAGRRELGVELSAPGARPGTGRDLILRARRLVPVGAPLFAAVSPGNARSLRAFLAAGFVPIASEVIIDRSGSGRT